MARNILVVDDEESIRDSVAAVLSDEGYRVTKAASADEAIDLFSKTSPDLVLLDIWMTSPLGEKQQAGFDILATLKIKSPSSTIIMMSGHGNIETAVKATKLGAYDFIEKPISLEKLLLLVQNAIQFRDLAKENEVLRGKWIDANILIGQSKGIQALKQTIRKVSHTSATVLITGENGTGKELVANLIHSSSPRSTRPLVAVNSAAIPEELIESELFGHERGAFTGAAQLKRGKFDQADGGTLFLDEIADMSLKTQAKVLRVLQEQRFERVGGSTTIEVDVRIIAATNRNLAELIEEQQFREDLFYRLNVVPIRVPPLRERVEDIALIANFYLQKFTPIDSQGGSYRLDDSAITLLEAYNWPGNVRELKNLMERVVIFSESPVIDASLLKELAPVLCLSKDCRAGASTARDLPLNLTNTGLDQLSGLSLRDARSEFEKEFILKKLNEHGWNVSKTALSLGVERSHLHRKLKSLGIDSDTN